VETAAVDLVAQIWVSTADIMGSVWPILVFPIGLAAVIAVSQWIKGLF